MHRIDAVKSLYAHLSQIPARRFTEVCHADVPKNGVYFFFEHGEMRWTTGNGRRIVRVGTHGLTHTSKATLWKRLAQHRGNAKVLAGNHRASIFRKLIGEALCGRSVELTVDSWGKGASAPPGAKKHELALESMVSAYVAEMPFIWLSVDDRNSRELIERNTIALLSNYKHLPVVDSPSSEWLGLYSGRKLVRESGLWNNDYVDAEYNAGFLDVIAQIAS